MNRPIAKAACVLGLAGILVAATAHAQPAPAEAAPKAQGAGYTPYTGCGSSSFIRAFPQPAKVPAEAAPAQAAPKAPQAGYTPYSGCGSRSFIRAFPKPAALKPAALKLTATVDGYTQPTEFNQQKYPFKYTGSSQLTADQVAALEKAGDVPADVTKAILGCLLWPKEGDTLENAALKSDGKKLTGQAEVLHKYGTQGTHTLKLKLEGAIEKGRVSLKVTDASVSGTWDSGFPIKLQGKVEVKIDVAVP